MLPLPMILAGEERAAVFFSLSLLDSFYPCSLGILISAAAIYRTLLNSSIVNFAKAAGTTRLVSLLQPGPETFSLFDEVSDISLPFPKIIRLHAFHSFSLLI
jgi:hypothetical protein